MTFALAMLIRPLVLVVLLYFIVKPLAKFILSRVKNPRLKRLLLRRLN